MSREVNSYDPRVKRTRRLIQQAFIALLKHRDFASITIKDIAEAAEINRATFYSHFQDKFQLLELTLSAMFEDTLFEWLPADSNFQTIDEVVKNLILAVCHWQLSTKNINRGLSLSTSIEENTKKQLYHIILTCLEQTQTIGLNNQRRLEITATVMSWSIYGVAMQWRCNSKAESPEELVEEALPIILSIIKSVGL